MLFLIIHQKLLQFTEAIRYLDVAENTGSEYILTLHIPQYPGTTALSHNIHKIYVKILSKLDDNILYKLMRRIMYLKNVPER